MYYFFAMHIYVILVILGLSLSVALILFIAELLFPKAVHIFNYSMTDKLFTELVKDHKYHAAIDLMEAKKDLIEDSKDPYKFRQELADCYVRTGDYPKALEQYRILRGWCTKMYKREMPEEWTPEQKRLFKDYINICFLREEFRIYLKIGDIANVRKYYGLMKTIHERTDWEKLNSIFGEEAEEKINDKLGGMSLGDGFRLVLIQGKFLVDPDAAIADMTRYAI